MQIPLMAEIYTISSYVLIWLGRSDHDSDYVMDCIRRHRHHREKFEEERFVIGLGRMYQRDWFKRVWVLQEFALNKTSPLMVCGTGVRVAWEEFEQAFPQHFSPEMFQFDIQKLQLAKKLYSASVWAAFHFLRKLRDSFVFNDQRKRISFKEYTLRSAIHATMRCKATDPRDKIYGILGLIKAEVRKEIVADYTKPVGEVFQDAMKRMLVIDPDPVIYARFPITAPQLRLERSSASWVLDFNPEVSDASSYLEMFDSAENPTATIRPILMEGQKLSVQGLFLGRIDHVLEANRQMVDSDENMSDSTPDLSHTWVSSMVAALGSYLEREDLMSFLVKLETFCSTKLANREGFTLVEPLWKTLLLMEHSDPRFRNEDDCQRKWMMLTELARVYTSIPTDHVMECLVSIMINGDTLNNLISRALLVQRNPSSSTAENLASASQADEGMRSLITHPELIYQMEENSKAWQAANPLSTQLQMVLCNNRCFFLGSNGCYGVGNPGVQKGDLLVLLFPDIYMPFILRECGDYYEMVALAYIPPLMKEQSILTGSNKVDKFIIV